MATIIGHLQARLSAASAAFQNDMNKAAKSVKFFGQSFSDLTKAGAIGGVAAGLATSAVSSLQSAMSSAAHAVVDLVSSQMKAIEETQLLAQRLDITTESLSRLQGAAALSDVEAKTFDKSLEKMTRTIATAALKGGEFAKTFGRLGLDVGDLAAMPVDEQFKTIADAISRTTNATLRARIAFNVFGSTGAEMQNMLRGGRAEIEATEKEFARIGRTVTDFEADQIAAANKAIDEFKIALKAGGTEMAVAFAPEIRRATNFMTEFAVETRKARKEFDFFLLSGITRRTIKAAFAGKEAGEPTAAGKGGGSEADAAATAAAEAVGKLTEELDRQIQTFGMSASEAKIFALELDGLKGAELEHVRALSQELEAKREHEKEQKRALQIGEARIKEHKSIVDGLQTQIDTFGMASHEADVYRLKMLGASEANIKMAESLSKQLAEQEKLADARREEGRENERRLREAEQQAKQAEQDREREVEQVKDRIKSEVERIYEATRTPLEKFQEEIANLETLFEAGDLGADTFARAIEQAQKELGGGEQVASVAAMEAGSSAAASTIARSANLGAGAMRPETETAKHARELVARAKAQEQLQRDIEINTRQAAPELADIAF